MSDIKIENPKIKEIIAALAPALHGDSSGIRGAAWLWRR